MADRSDDVALVERIHHDPAAGWAATWDTHGTAIHAYCLRMLDDRAEADDAAADVFLVAAQRVDQLRDPSALRAWLFAIARRRVQQRWRQRTRTVPVDPHGAIVSGHAADVIDASGAADAAELLHAASAGLSPADRELLALSLGADLDTAEMAKVTGETTNAVSVRVTRLKETVGRAAGALLVARHHRRDCPDLDALLHDWDATFDTVWRKRIARHVDGCDQCADRRRAAVGAFAAPLLLAPPSSALRDRVLQPIASWRATGLGDAPPPFASEIDTGGRAGPDHGPYDRSSGFPVAEAWERRRRGWFWWVVAALCLIVVGVMGMRLSADDAGVASNAGAPSSASTSVPRLSTSTTLDRMPPRVAPTTAPPSSGSAPPSSGSAPTVTTGSTTVTTPPTRPAPPTVAVRVQPSELLVGAGSSESARATVSVTAADGTAETTVRWDGPDAGSVVVAGTGTQSVDIGPFSSSTSTTGDPEVITVTATTIDAFGRQAMATTTFTVTVVFPQ